MPWPGSGGHGSGWLADTYRARIAATRRARPPGSPPPLRAPTAAGAAAAIFLARSTPATTRPSYAQTRERRRRAYGDLPLRSLDGAALHRFTAAAWPACAATTWNRHRDTLRSFSAHAHRRGGITDDPTASLERRREPEDRTKAIPQSALDRLLHRGELAVWEKCLWGLLYETAARTGEVLSASIDDLDIENQGLRIRRKGGNRGVADPRPTTCGAGGS